jgi:catechol 2,3-dioxygenase-like lactoylglutathione lyase family enzyme
MTWHTGRLIDHIHLRARNYERSRTFFTAILQVLGVEISRSGDGWMQVDELYIDAADPGATPSHVHLAFQAKDRAMVDAFFDAAVVAGGEDNGPPGERPYHPGYYGAFVLDPDGNNIEAVYHGPSKRSAASVEIRSDG